MTVTGFWWEWDHFTGGWHFRAEAIFSDDPFRQPTNWILFRETKNGAIY